MDRPRPRGLSSSGKVWAALVAVLVALMLPKHVKCGYPGRDRCQEPGPFHLVCDTYEVEPLGFFLVELLVGDDVGFAYSSGKDCH